MSNDLQELFNQVFSQEVDYYILSNIDEREHKENFYCLKIKKEGFELIEKSLATKNIFVFNFDSKELSLNSEPKEASFLADFRIKLERIVTDWQDDKTQLLEKRKADPNQENTTLHDLQDTGLAGLTDKVFTTNYEAARHIRQLTAEEIKALTGGMSPLVTIITSQSQKANFSSLSSVKGGKNTINVQIKGLAQVLELKLTGTKWGLGDAPPEISKKMHKIVDSLIKHLSPEGTLKNAEVKGNQIKETGVWARVKTFVGANTTIATIATAADMESASFHDLYRGVASKLCRLLDVPVPSTPEGFVREAKEIFGDAFPIRDLFPIKDFATKKLTPQNHQKVYDDMFKTGDDRFYYWIKDTVQYEKDVQRFKDAVDLLAPIMDQSDIGKTVRREVNTINDTFELAKEVYTRYHKQFG